LFRHRLSLAIRVLSLVGICCIFKPDKGRYHSLNPRTFSTRQMQPVRRAGEITGIAAADFSRIRRANLDRFTVDRLMTILARLDQHVDVTVKVTARRTKKHPATARPSH